VVFYVLAFAEVGALELGEGVGGVVVVGGVGELEVFFDAFAGAVLGVLEGGVSEVW
jgi:hypothetical protein